MIVGWLWVHAGRQGSSLTLTRLADCLAILLAVIHRAIALVRLLGIMALLPHVLIRAIALFI